MKLLFSLSVLLLVAGGAFAQNQLGSSESLNSTVREELFQLDDEPIQPMNLDHFNIDEFIKLYPNPVINIFNLDTEIIKQVDVVVYDLRGVRMDFFRGELGQTVDMDISKYPTGFYLVHIVADDRVFVEKILKQ